MPPKIKKQTVKKKTVKRTMHDPPRKKTGGIRDKIVPVSIDDHVKLSVYGRSGTGKTQFWSTFPGKLLVLTCSGGNRAGELKTLSKEARKRTSMVVIDQTEVFNEVVNYQEESVEFDTIILDHATGFQDLVLKEILGIDKLPEQRSWGMAKQQDWGQCSLKVKESLRSLINLDCNIVIISQQREFSPGEDSDIVMPYIGSALSPSVTGWLNTACDYVVQTFLRNETKVVKLEIAGKKIEREEETGKIEYCLRTGPDPIYTTKFRMPMSEVSRIPDVIVNPTYDKIMKIVNG